MLFVAIILAGLSAWAVAAAVIALRHDGYRAVPTRPGIRPAPGSRTRGPSRYRDDQAGTVPEIRSRTAKGASIWAK